MPNGITTDQIGIAPYIIELIRGPLDGLVQPRYEVPLSKSIAVSGPDLAVEKRELRRHVSVYEWKDTLVRMIDGLPVLVFRHQFVGARFSEKRDLWYHWLLGLCT